MEIIDLPEPSFKGTVSVEEAIYKRRSYREFLPQALSLKEISQLLWATGGANVDAVTGPTRTYPSAGGIYPLEIYLVAGNVAQLPAGVYKYNWRTHQLIAIKKGDVRKELARACLGQIFISKAPATIVLAAVFEKTTVVYGERGYIRYIPMDAGHAAENLYLQATAMGLGTVAVGAFYDEEVKRVLEIKEHPIYILPVGRIKR